MAPILIAWADANRTSTAKRRWRRSRRNAGAQPRGTRSSFDRRNSESQLIDWIHEATDHGSGIVINPAAYSFTSIAILDALKMFPGPIIELHISNIHKREEHYHHSYVSKIATAVIAGLGPEGYAVAIRAIVAMIEREPAT